MKVSNNVVALVAHRENQMAETEIINMALEDSDRSKGLVNRLYAGTVKLMGQYGTISMHVKYDRTTKTDDNTGKNTTKK